MAEQVYVYRKVRCPACTGTGYVRQALCGTCQGKGQTTQDVPLRQALLDILGDRTVLHALRVSLAALESAQESEFKESIGKFGTRMPSLETRCRVCGQDWGHHFNLDCPPMDGSEERCEQAPKPTPVEISAAGRVAELEGWQSQACAVLQGVLDSHHFCAARFELGDLPSMGLPCHLCTQAKALLQKGAETDGGPAGIISGD